MHQEYSYRQNEIQPEDRPRALSMKAVSICHSHTFAFCVVQLQLTALLTNNIGFPCNNVRMPGV